MASYEKRPRIDIKKFTVCSNVVVKCGTKTVDLIRKTEITMTETDPKKLRSEIQIKTFESAGFSPFNESVS
jgi:hypothetical protein